MSLGYGIVTPVLNQANELRRLAECVLEQTVAPTAWVVVDQGSVDGTRAIAESLANEHSWIRVVATTIDGPARVAPTIHAFHAGLAQLDPTPDVVVRLEADTSLARTYFERLLQKRVAQADLAAAAPPETHQGDGVWRQRHGTGPGVWGACRAYRRDCLDDLLPLEEHMGWDTLDLQKAVVKGWVSQLFLDLPFRHHRSEGIRDGARFRTWVIQGEATHFMSYRVSYLLARTFYRVPRDPTAIGLLVGYGRALARRRPRCADLELRTYVREQQSLRRLPLRAREALRPRAVLTNRP
jgi:biofilm PGA synthesis N-glycosyltransferase PgaC